MYKLTTSDMGILEKGVRTYAKEVDVHENMLRHYLRRIKRKELNLQSVLYNRDCENK